jgi:hypothetical protein
MLESADYCMQQILVVNVRVPHGGRHFLVTEQPLD